MTPDQLRSLLDSHDVSQRELARRLHVSQSTVFRWAQGRVEIDRRSEAAIRYAVCVNDWEEV
ncbi:MAG: helix-turn-helix domain-containing protein [Saprospiraceae bacterium]|nr:helix-turn-helix domain-containing protein [Saprospiraceae bacterium]